MRVHFVLPKGAFKKIENYSSIDIEKNFPYWIGGKINWVLRSYFELRKLMENVTIGEDAQPGIINFSHSQNWFGRARVGEFRVGVRADYFRVYDIDYEVVQNKNQATNRSKRVYLPYWPVPYVVPRDKSRLRIENIVYSGRLGRRNLGQFEFSPTLQNFLSKNHLNFLKKEPSSWHEHSTTDLMIAIRSLDKNYYNEKPASKLFLSYRTGVPLITGYDSAYSQHGVPGRSFLPVGSENELVCMLDDLINTPLYQNVVDATYMFNSTYSDSWFQKTWLEAFQVEIMSAFLNKKDHSPIGRMLDQGRSYAQILKSKLV